MTGLAAYLVAIAVASSASVAAPDGPGVPADLSHGDRGPAVAALNVALEQAGFHADDGDVFGKRTRHAVYAFQKVHGLPTTGTFTPFMWDLLDETPRLPQREEADRIEIDLGKQVLYVVEDQQVVLIVPISSGSGAPYIGSNGRRHYATTPEGKFRFQRRVRGWREAPLGFLYNPYYFYGGVAVHGSYSVPNYPASHGCVRVTTWDMDLLMKYLEVGETVYVYGKRRPMPVSAPADPKPSYF